MGDDEQRVTERWRSRRARGRTAAGQQQQGSWQTQSQGVCVCVCASVCECCVRAMEEWLSSRIGVGRRICVGDVCWRAGCLLPRTTTEAKKKTDSTAPLGRNGWRC